MKSRRIPKKERKKHVEEILDGEYPEEAKATVGENRGQLFVRIPQVISRRMNIKKNNIIIFRVKTLDRKNTLSVEVE